MSGAIAAFTAAGTSRAYGAMANRIFKTLPQERERCEDIKKAFGEFIINNSPIEKKRLENYCIIMPSSYVKPLGYLRDK
ncbi:hypothetical protein FACS1894152_3550 [Bacilli bacterium]|nr:hypothetical protein FACS1894152_3550 [Bacilli bacterium]